MYKLTEYSRLIDDRVRTDSYAEALRRAVTPASVVLDLGTGTGIFALLACRFGARRVYALEPSDAIYIARDLAAANGYSDRIELIQAMSTDVTLPERADVLVAEIHGTLPLFGDAVASILDARRRLLAPNATLIPRREVVWASVVEAPDAYREAVLPRDGDVFGLDFDPARRLLANSVLCARPTVEQLMASPQRWATLDYASIESPDVDGDVAWTVTRGGTAHGVVAWFDTELAEGIGLSNAPGAPEMIFGRHFLPWPEPVKLAAGDHVSISLSATLVGDEYVWRWRSSILKGEGAGVIARFAQSSFLGWPLVARRLEKLASGHVPTLAEDGEIDRIILACMDGRQTLGDIARRVADRFPARFPDWPHALTRVGELSQRYSR
jgi:protein arginine N-methyltransferase 1